MRFYNISKKKKENKAPEAPDDDRKMFLLSLLPDVKSLSAKYLRKFKIETLTLLEKLIMEQEHLQASEHIQINSSSSIPYPQHRLHHESASRCSSGFSINNTVSSPASSPIDIDASSFPSDNNYYSTVNTDEITAPSTNIHRQYNRFPQSESNNYINM